MQREMDAVGDRRSSPLAIGGIGGSGTRVIARLLLELGHDMGSDLNDSLDNLWFTLLFKRLEWLDPTNQAEFSLAIQIFGSIMAGGAPLGRQQKALIKRLARERRAEHPSRWLQDRAATLRAATGQARSVRGWGWKEPNTHVFLRHFLAHWPAMRYIHVMRHGMDMALSANQNQLMLWGSYFLGAVITDPTPRQSLAYWCEVHRRVLQTTQGMHDRFLLLNYDEFCARPREGLQKLLDFLKSPTKGKNLDRLTGLISVPESVGRYRNLAPETFAPEDAAYVRTLGFPVEFVPLEIRPAAAE